MHHNAILVIDSLLIFVVVVAVVSVYMHTIVLI